MGLMLVHLKLDDYITDSRSILMFRVDYSLNYIGVKPLIHQSELGTYTKVVPFQENSSFHFVVLWKLLNGMD